MCTGAGDFRANIRRHLGNDQNDRTSAMRTPLTDRLDDLGHIEKWIVELIKEIEGFAHGDETLRRRLTIPRIGARVAAAGDGRQFLKARVIAAWLGLVSVVVSTADRFQGT